MAQGDILEDSASKGNVQNLHPAADSKDREFQIQKILHQVDMKTVSMKIRGSPSCHEFFTKRSGVMSSPPQNRNPPHKLPYRA